MKKRFLTILLLICIISVLCPVTARADMGPKPSVHITFQGMEDRQYYATLLSNTASHGPWSENREYEGWMGSEQVWEAFRSYQDTDGFFFLGYFQDCTKEQVFSWNYYPPEHFKILLYFPDSNTFLISEKAYKRYAFDSYFTIDLSALKVPGADKKADPAQKIVFEDSQAPLEKTYPYKGEFLSLLARIIGTLLIELAVAWPFGYWKKRPLLIIFFTNLLTQTLLNVGLNLVNFYSGYLAFLFSYVWLEILVFLIEGTVYWKFMNKPQKGAKKAGHPWIYAAIANALSFLVGFFIARWVPGIF